MNSNSTQELIVFLIVAIAAAYILWNIFMKYGASATSLWLIRKGYTKVGFWLKNRLPQSACGNCSCGTEKKQK